MAKYHQSRKDRRHESEGMKSSHHEERGKYHQSMMERMHESEGMKAYKDEYRGSMDSRFMGMISEDHHEVANLPQHVVQQTYPASRWSDKYELDDTIRGIDENIDDTIRTMDQYPSTSMY